MAASRRIRARPPAWQTVSKAPCGHQTDGVAGFVTVADVTASVVSGHIYVTAAGPDRILY